MKAIYDMMGKCTYPVLREETPRQHVEVFFQAGVPGRLSTPEGGVFTSSVSCLPQKMDRNKDGVVTIDEFIDCCQNVRRLSRSGRRRRTGLSVTLFFVSRRTRTS